ncbi:MAG TPA: hypothetical protein DEA16_00480, partial [Opitutae bacterium]|nr:hypothetical protein [Opitutae bacterium]
SKGSIELSSGRAAKSGSENFEMSKKRKYNRAIRGTGLEYGRGILGRQVFYRESVNQVEFLPT